MLVDCTGEEHAIDTISIRAIQLETPAVERLLQDAVGLVDATEDRLVESKTTTFAHSAADLSLEVLHSDAQKLNVVLVGIGLQDNR